MEKKEFLQICQKEFISMPASCALLMWETFSYLPGYFEAPAAASHHGNFDGGLFKHSLEVAKYLEYYTQGLKLTWQSKNSPYVVGLLHDACKVDDYIKNADGSWSFNPYALEGHGTKSVQFIKNLTPLVLTEEEEKCIEQHMGAFVDSSRWADYSSAVKQFPNVLYTHTADMAASQILGV